MLFDKIIIDASHNRLIPEEVILILESLDSNITKEKTLLKLTKKQLVGLLITSIKINKLK